MATPIHFSTLTMSVVGTAGTVCGAGMMSFRVSDKASRAKSAPPVSCVSKEKWHKWITFFKGKTFQWLLAPVTEGAASAGPQADFTAGAAEEEMKSPASKSNAASAGDWGRDASEEL